MQAAAVALSRQGQCMTMLASGVSLPGMRNGRIWRTRTAYSTWTPQKPTLFDGHYLRNRSTLDTGVLGYIGIVQHKEHSPEVLSIPPGTSCIQWLKEWKQRNMKLCDRRKNHISSKLCMIYISSNNVRHPVMSIQRAVLVRDPITYCYIFIF